MGMKQLGDGAAQIVEAVAEVVGGTDRELPGMTQVRLLFLRWYQRENTERVSFSVFEGVGSNWHVEVTLDSSRKTFGGRAPVELSGLKEEQVAPTPEAGLKQIAERLAERLRLRAISDLGMLQLAGRHEECEDAIAQVTRQTLLRKGIGR